MIPPYGLHISILDEKQSVSYNILKNKCNPSCMLFAEAMCRGPAEAGKKRSARVQIFIGTEDDR
jgi:hypothetical protein